MTIFKRVLAALFVSALMLAALTPLLQAQDQPSFTIGVLDSADGSIARGAQLGAYRYNQFGGVRGADGTLFEINLVVEPFDAATLSDTVTRFSENNVIAVIGPADSTALVDNLPILEALQVPIFTPATSDQLLSQDNTGLVYRTRARSLEQSRALAAFLTQELQFQNIATVQVDAEPNTQVNTVSFTDALPVAPVSDTQIAEAGQTEQVAADVAALTPEVVVAYGAPEQAAALHNALRSASYGGYFAYPQANDPVFQQAILDEQLPGVITTATWSVANDDEASNTFALNYVQAFEQAPDAVAAASYDAVQLIATAISQGGEFVETLASQSNLPGVQGTLLVDELEDREMSNNTVIITYNALGGQEVIARYAGDVRLPDEVYVVVTSQVQNVRTGPSTDFEILGQIEQGTRLSILGTNADQTWIVVDYRDQQGWMAAYLLDIRGNLSSTPIIEEPALPDAPTPDPAASPVVTVTPTVTAGQPSAEADVVIDSAVVNPFPIVPNQPFDIAVTVRNAGMTDAGEFAIATTLAPNELYLSAVVPGLPAGQSTTVNLNGTLANTGGFVVDIVADLNNQIAEGEAGEANNNFAFTYVVNRVVERQDMRVLNPGDVMDLEGDMVEEEAERMDDLQWDGNVLNTIATARVAVINPGQDGFNWAATGADPANNLHWNLTNPDVVSRIHWDLIDPNVVNQPNIPPDQIVPGALIGVITADGNRALLRVDDRPEGNQLTVTFLVYEEEA